jgi:protein-S-isoprenylcysteine O-methyltransferase Ste14
LGGREALFGLAEGELMEAHLQTFLEYLFAAMGVYWIVRTKRSSVREKGEGNAFRVLRLTILVVTFSLLFSSWLRIAPLGWRFVPRNQAIEIAGAIMAVAGLSITVWAREHLGRNWSDKVEIKVNHELIRSGPYAHMRHPIYSGMLLAVAGTALAIGEWRGVVSFCILATSYSIKAKKEERVLAQKFGERFRMYQNETGFLIPR